MQTVNASLQTELDKGLGDPVILVDLFEFYDADATPGATGFDPTDAVETFAGQEITWNSIAYRREVISRGDIVKSISEKINSVTITFSNISRYLATLAQSQQMEGMIVVIRCVSPSVTTDSLILFTGRCGKPSDIDKKTFSVTVTQDFGNINITIPPNKFESDDPEGRLPSDPEFEGIPFNAINGSLTFPQVVPSTSFFGRLIGRRKTISVTQQWSSTDSTPYGQVIRECFGITQVELVIFNWADKGSHVGYLAAVCRGPVDAITNIKSRTEGLSDPICSFANPPAPAVTHLGEVGAANGAATCQADLARGLYFSKLAFVEGAAAGYQNGQIIPLGLDVADTPPLLTALVRGKKMPVRNSSGVYGGEEWTNNPVDVWRFLRTDPKFGNIDPAFMEDSVNHRTGLHCDAPLVDDSGSQVIVIPSAEISVAGDLFSRYRASGLYTPRYFLYNNLGDVSIVPELEDGPYIGIDPGDPLPDPNIPSDPTYVSQKPLIKRYTFNATISEEVRLADFINKTLLPTFKGFERVNKNGKIECLSEIPSDATRLRTATAVGATSIPILDVTPWKSGSELLKGRILLGAHLTNSEVRTPSAAVYSTSGNSIGLAASDSGGVTATASGANLSGGSTTVQASGTITIGGTPGTGDTATATIDGIDIPYVLDADDTTETVAAMLTHYINANQRLNKYIRATWDGANLITITCLHGALTVPALLKAHTTAIADPTSAPTAVGASGGSLPAGTYLLAYADVNGIGETVLTSSASVVVTANQKIDISALPALVGTSRNFYLSERADSTNLRFSVNRTNNSNFSISAVPDAGAASPPTWNQTAEELIRVAKSFATNSQDVYPEWHPSFLVTLNDVYLPTALNGHRYQVTTGGTTGTTEPTWPTTAGGTVASGTAVFTEIGSTVLAQAGLTRANVIKDSFKWPLGSRQSTVNRIETDYRSAKDDFALQPLAVNDPVHQAYVKKKYPMKIDLSGVDNFNQAKRLCNFNLSKYREGDHFHALGTGPSGLVLEEGDVICTSDDSGGLINIITRIEELRITKDHDVYITQARKYSTNMFSDDVGAHVIPIPSTLRFAATKDTIFELIDTFAIRDNDALQPGWYVVATHDLGVEGDWRGYRILADYGDGDVEIVRGDVPAVMGTADTTLATVSDPSVFDRVNSFTFTLVYDDSTLASASVTEQELLSSFRRNLFLVGNELLQAATITLVGPNQYTASVLLRGRFGADNWQLTHGANERVILLNGAEKFIPIDPVRLNVEFDYTGVTTNQDDADGLVEAATWTGGTVKPYSPVNLRGTRNAVFDLDIEWLRRDRTSLGLRDLAGTPLSEERAIFLLKIFDGSTEVRRVRILESVRQTERISWQEFYDPDDNLSVASDQTLEFLDVSDNAATLSEQTFTGDFTIEFVLNSNVPPTYMGVCPSVVADVQNLGNGLFATQGYPYVFVQGTSNVRPMGNTSYQVTGSAGDVISIQRSGDVVRFFKNAHLSVAAVPFYETSFSSAQALRVFAKFTNGVGTEGLDPSRMNFFTNTRYRYTANQQVDDFGSTQSTPGSVKVRVSQESAIVGEGDYREALL